MRYDNKAPDHATNGALYSTSVNSTQGHDVLAPVLIMENDAGVLEVVAVDKHRVELPIEGEAGPFTGPRGAAWRRQC